MAMPRSEFTVIDQHRSDRRGPGRWIVSHLLQYRRYVVGFLGGSLLMVVLNSAIPGLTGSAFDAVLAKDGSGPGRLVAIALTLVAIVLLRGVFDLIARLCTEVLAKRLERDAREELYVSLLGKSQTFHNRQRVGDLMARATNDVRQLSMMIMPGRRPDRRLDASGHRARSSSSPSSIRSCCRAAALRRRLRASAAPLHAPAQPGLRLGCASSSAAQRRAERSRPRHRGGQGHRAGGAGAATVRRQRPQLPRLLRPAGRRPGPLPAAAAPRGRDRGRTAARARALPRRRALRRRAGRLHGADGPAGLPDRYLDLHLLAGPARHRQRRPHPRADATRRPSSTRTPRDAAQPMRGRDRRSRTSRSATATSPVLRNLSFRAGPGRPSRSSGRPARARPR